MNSEERNNSRDGLHSGARFSGEQNTSLNHSRKFDTHLALQQCAPTQPARVYARITSSARCFATVHKLSGTRVRTRMCAYASRRGTGRNYFGLALRTGRDLHIQRGRGYRERLASDEQSEYARKREGGRKKGKQAGRREDEKSFIRGKKDKTRKG